jgi:hypothetical protein
MKGPERDMNYSIQSIKPLSINCPSGVQLVNTYNSAVAY